MSDFLVDLKRKFEAITPSRKVSGRMKKYYELLGQKGGLGEFLGFVAVRKSKPQINAACFESAIICHIYDKGDTGSMILGGPIVTGKQIGRAHV